MASLQNSPSVHRTLFLGASSKVHSPSQLGSRSSGSHYCSRRGGVSFTVKAEQTVSPPQDRTGRRQALAVGAIATCISLISPTSETFAAEAKKGFLSVLDKKDGYEFLYPFGWQEVVIEGQDKVFKDVIEPLETVSVNLIQTSKQDIKDLGSPHEVAEVLIKKVLAPPSQKTKLIEASEHDIDGKTFYNFEFVAQAPNYTRHALGTISILNGKLYALTTGSNERRWGKMKDKLRAVVDSFKISNV